MESPKKDCALCPRLVAFRCDNQKKFPDKFNGAVPSFGGIDAPILIVGLAPGLKGANFTGRPFTGDYAGDVLYDVLKNVGFAVGDYQKHKDDGIALKGVRITNAVRCVPPQNKPTGDEIKECFPFLIHEIEQMKNLKALVALGGIAHRQVVKAMSAVQAKHKFSHGGEHRFSDVLGHKELRVFDTYHCSRYNINTRRVTAEMIQDVFEAVKVYVAP